MEEEKKDVLTMETVAEPETKQDDVKKQKKEKKAKKEKEKKPVDPAKKKKKRRIIILSVVGVFVLYLIVSNVVAANTPVSFYTTAAERGDITQTINTSGSVTSNEEKTYFSDVNVKIGSVKVEAGDAVKKGDVLISYDENALSQATELAQLDKQAAEGSYRNSVQTNNEKLGDLNEANVNLEVLDQQIEDTQAYITSLNNKIQKKKDDLAHFGTLLQISLLDWQDQPDSDEYMNLQKQIQLNTYEQSHNKEIEGWESELEVYNDMLSKYKEYRSEMKSQKSSADSSKMTAGAKEELEAGNQTKEIQSEDKITKLEAAADGVTAEFDGVVTSVSAVEGSTAAEGTELLKLESTEDVCVKISVTKYDLDKIALSQKATVTIGGKEYEGEVSKINKMAQKNDSGAAVVGTEIKILNPDSDVYLGVEAKVVIETGESKDTILVPVTAVNVDSTGEFVYAIENNMVVKKQVETGISSDTLTEILSGVSEGDQLITEVNGEITEGMAAVAVPMN